MDWSKQFENYINNFTDIHKFTLEDFKNNKDSSKLKNNSTPTIILYNMKLQTDWINGKDITIGNKFYGDSSNKYIMFTNEDTYIIENIRNIFNSYFENEFKYSKNKYFEKSYKINSVDFKKYKYFMSCNFDDNSEYVKINPNFKTENMESILKICKFKILCVPWIMKSNGMIGLKIDSIVIDYNKNLLKYKSIKDIVDIVVRNKKKEIKESNKTDVILENKFNKYKYKNKTKIDESNNKILDFINHNLHTF
jgi:hypothetical protein